MKVKLLSNSKLSVAVIAGRTCWNSFHKGGCYSEQTDDISKTDKEFLDRIINKNKHSSVAEHLVYSFNIDGISRACLQELARTRIASLSVKSTRYTLKEIKKIDNPLIEEIQEENITDYIVDTAKCEITGKKYKIDREKLENYLVMAHSPTVNIASAKALENLRLILKSGLSNDIAKYCLPESFKTSLGWTINARSLQNFLTLRTSPHALWEIRDLAFSIYTKLPEDHKYLFKDCIYS